MIAVIATDPTVVNALPESVNFARYNSLGLAAAAGAIAEASAVLLDCRAVVNAAAMGGLDRDRVALVVAAPNAEAHAMATLAGADVLAPTDVVAWLGH